MGWALTWAGQQACLDLLTSCWPHPCYWPRVDFFAFLCCSLLFSVLLFCFSSFSFYLLPVPMFSPQPSLFLILLFLFAACSRLRRQGLGEDLRRQIWIERTPATGWGRHGQQWRGWVGSVLSTRAAARHGAKLLGRAAWWWRRWWLWARRHGEHGLAAWVQRWGAASKLSKAHGWARWRRLGGGLDKAAAAREHGQWGRRRILGIYGLKARAGCITGQGAAHGEDWNCSLIFLLFWPLLFFCRFLVLEVIW